MRVESADTADLDAFIAAARTALDGRGPALGLGGLAGPVREAPEGTAVVVTTSGSTGVPKSVALSADALRASDAATAARIGVGAWVLALPTSYVAGLQVVLRSIAAGHRPEALPGAFGAVAFAAAARRLPPGVPHFTSMVPAQLSTVIDAAAHDGAVRDALVSFDAILVGGQALPTTLRERAADLGARVVRTYGSTETCGGCVYDGVPLDGAGMRVVDGEVQLTGPMLATGYVGEPERTARAFHTDGAGVRWYRTGDAGTVADGVLQVTGRLDNVIVSGGVNVSLDRVERVVRDLPGFARAVVVPIADARWGQGSAVVVERSAGSEEAGALHRVRESVRERIGPPARPARIVVVDDIPSLASGKPDRLALRRIVAERP